MQILAFVSKVHQVVLPEDAVDYETVTLEKVYVLPTISLYQDSPNGHLLIFILNL